MAPEIWIPIATLILGYVGSLVTESFRDKRLATRERLASEAEREEFRTRRRDDFQRETLIELQDALLEVARQAGDLYHWDLKQHRETGQWGRNPSPSDMDEIARRAHAKASALRVRVLDDELRKLVDEMTRTAVMIALAKSPIDAGGLLHEMSDKLVEVNERLGALLRNLY